MRTETHLTIPEYYKSRFYSTLRIVRLVMKAKCEIHLFVLCTAIVWRRHSVIVLISLTRNTRYVHYTA